MEEENRGATGGSFWKIHPPNSTPAISPMNAPNHSSDTISTPSAANDTDRMERGAYVGLNDDNGDQVTSTDFKSSRLPGSRFVVTNQHARECLAEFLGTFVMICFGMGVNNQVSLSKDKNGTWLSINMCWGVAVMLGVHVADGISGAHLNPAVTLAMATFGRLSWRKVPGYILAQCVGAFIGAAVIFGLYRDLLNEIDPDRTTTRSSFSTYPRSDITNVTAFYTEFVGTALLLLGVFAITDKRNRPASPYGVPLHFMVLIWAIGMAFGMNTGYAINPARDFGPRLFTSMAGWGSAVFTLRSHYFWIPIVAPSLGGVFGAGLYELLVEMHHPPLAQSQLPV